MEIWNEGSKPYNFTDRTRPLFDAMVAGKTIKSIRLMRGTMRKDDLSQDFIIHNVKAITYCVGMAHSESDGYSDFVDIVRCVDEDAYLRDCFWMNWVREFEIGDEVDEVDEVDERNGLYADMFTS